MLSGDKPQRWKFPLKSFFFSCSLYPHVSISTHFSVKGRHSPLRTCANCYGANPLPSLLRNIRRKEICTIRPGDLTRTHQQYLPRDEQVHSCFCLLVSPHTFPLSWWGFCFLLEYFISPYNSKSSPTSNMILKFSPGHWTKTQGLKCFLNMRI